MEANGDETLNSDERDGCRSLLCDSNGIIIAEMVYRCMRCSYVNDYMGEARKHYHEKHMAQQLSNNYVPIETSKCGENFENVFEKQVVNGKSCYGTCNGKVGPKLVDSCSKKRDSNSKAKSNNSTPTESCTRSGYITCPVCTSTRFYTTLQRRYGQFTCVACYRFFKEFFIKPKVYSCPNLGECKLDVKSKCKACWIFSCINTYSVDERRKTILEANKPCRYLITDTSSASSLSPPSVGRLENVKQEITFEDTPDLPDDKANKVDVEDEVESKVEIASQSCEEELEDDEDEFDDSFDEELANDRNADSPNGDHISRRAKSRVKNWCCLQCTNCLAEDCGTCINCLDRPKFGGPFVRKQRCVNKKCLLKLSK